MRVPGAALVAAVVVGIVAGDASPASANHESETFPTSSLIGPVVGWTWGGGARPQGLVGVEAGLGFNLLLYANAGLTLRNDEVFAYAELDGWLLIGATAGFGYGTKSEWQPVLGVWEALPVQVGEPSCSNQRVLVISAGYRWTGMHELYVAPKYGMTEVSCWESG